MRISYLHEFAVLAQKLSFTDAAKELHISQSTLSKHLTALEEDLGVRLLNRNKHLVELSDQGEQFLDVARSIPRAYHQARHALRASAIEDTCLLMGGLVDSPPEFEILSRALWHVQKIAPSCMIHFVPVITSTERSQLAEGLIDCAFTSFNPDAATEAELELFEYIPIGKMPCVGIVRKSNPLAEKERLSVRDLEGATLIRLTGSRSHSGWSNIRYHLDRHRVSVSLRTCNIISINDYINVSVEDNEVFILPVMELREGEQRYADCAFVPMDAAELSFPIGVLFRKDSGKRELIAAVARSMYDAIVEKNDPGIVIANP